MDKIEICNMALSRLGIELIESIDEASEQARACKQFYDHTRRNLLRRYPWPFATRRAALAQLTDTPENYDYAYRYPTNCVCIRKIFDAEYNRISNNAPYQIASDTSGRVIYTNIEKANIEYTADIEDCSLFDEHFMDILAWKLAAEMANKLTGSTNMTQLAEQQFNSLYLEAIANGEDEQNVYPDRHDSLIMARFGGL